MLSAEPDGRQDRAHHRHRAGAVQDRDDEPSVTISAGGSARADGGCARLSGVGVASCNGHSARRLTCCDLHETIRTSHIPRTKVVRKCF
jgi:hypothetical protein